MALEHGKINTDGKIITIKGENDFIIKINCLEELLKEKKVRVKMNTNVNSMEISKETKAKAKAKLTTDGKTIWFKIRNDCSLRINCLEELLKEKNINVKLDIREIMDVSIDETKGE